MIIVLDNFYQLFDKKILLCVLWALLNKMIFVGLGRPWPALAGQGWPWPDMASNGHGRQWPAMAGLGQPLPAMVVMFCWEEAWL